MDKQIFGYAVRYHLAFRNRTQLTMTNKPVETVGDFHDYCNDVCNSLYKTNFGIEYLVPFSKWLNKAPEVIKSDDPKGVLIRCANDKRFKSVDDPTYGVPETNIFQDLLSLCNPKDIAIFVATLIFVRWLLFVFFNL